MNDALIAIAFIAGVIATGASFALGFAAICKLLEWAPVNITVNVNNYQTKEEDHRS